MMIRVLSLDFDGCLFHQGYISSGNKDVINSNADFLATIKQTNQEFTKVYTLVGSNRQSFNVDLLNMIGKGSCFPAIQRISRHLDTTFDRFLLADIFGDLPAGTSYNRAMISMTGGFEEGESHSDWIFDETKVTLIYAQIHKIATQHPNEPIIFDFYDDRGNGARAHHDILEHLRDFYTTHAHLIPANVTLRLHQYAGGPVTLMNEIKGTGFIDENYRQTVKDLSQQAITEFDDGYHTPIYVATTARPEELKNRKALSVDSLPLVLPNNALLENTLDGANLNTVPAEPLAKSKFSAALQKILDKSAALNQAGDELYNEHLSDSEQSDIYYSYKNAADAARDLHHALDSASQTYFQDYDKEAFKASAEKAISDAQQSELQQHRGALKQILSYAGLAVLAVLSIATAGIAYVVAGSINYAINRQFFFSTKVNTDSINKVNELKDSVDELLAFQLTV